jgi:hypothetical protein
MAPFLGAETGSEAQPLFQNPRLAGAPAQPRAWR